MEDESVSLSFLQRGATIALEVIVVKQSLLSLSSGDIEIVDVPRPRPGPRDVIVQTRASLISAGTERMLIDFGKNNLLDKVRSQPARVRQVADKVRTDGLVPTVRAVQAKLAEPIPLGYCNAGVVLEVGAEVLDVRPGDRVVCNGPHAELVRVPRNLCAIIADDEVSFEQASFVVLAAIGLEGLRLANVSLGETFMVTGLGLIGLITAQLLTSAGCRVLGFDPSAERMAMARELGVLTPASATTDPVGFALEATAGRGVDGVLITAATDSNGPVRDAAQMSRKRGRIVLVGVTGLKLDRAAFYEKELSFQVSCSYGPGRYDDAYERGGIDYPLPYVRWTAGRNFEAVLDLLARNRLDFGSLISQRLPFEKIHAAWEHLSDPKTLGVVLSYRESVDERTRIEMPTVRAGRSARPRIGVVGAGNFAMRTLLPVLAKADAELVAVAASGGTASALAARAFGIRIATSDAGSIFDDASIDAVFLLTRHDNHAALTTRALESGKHVFVEKPLCIDREQHDALESTYQRLAQSGSAPLLCVGFNRRFAPMTQRLVEQLAEHAGPRRIVMTVNAGDLPREHWLRNRAVGGGRLIGEGCHFIDLARFLAGTAIRSVDVVGDPSDSFSLVMSFEGEHTAAITYLSEGHRSYPKERIEVFAGGHAWQIDNFRRLRTWPSSPMAGLSRTLSQDKGHQALVAAFIAAVASGGVSPIPPAEVFEVSRWVLEAGGARRESRERRAG